MNLIEHIAQHLEFLGLGYVATQEMSGNIFWGNMPDFPDESMCVYSSDSSFGGSDTGARIQITVRANNTRASYELSQRIADELIEFDGYLHGDGPHVFIDPINVSTGLGADAKRREIYSSNFLVHYCNY